MALPAAIQQSTPAVPHMDANQMRALLADTPIQANDPLLLQVWAPPGSTICYFCTRPFESQHLSPFSDYHSFLGLMGPSKFGFQSQMCFGGSFLR